MKRHIFGITFFVSVIAAFILAFCFLNFLASPSLDDVPPVILSKNAETVSCASDEIAEGRILQAIAYRKTGRIIVKADITDSGETAFPGASTAILYFYTASDGNLKYVRSAEMEILVGKRPHADERRLAANNNAWLQDIRSADNLYVSFSRFNVDAACSLNNAIFDGKAVSVLVAEE